MTTEQYQSERAFYTRACKDRRLTGRGAAQAAPVHRGQSHGFAVRKPSAGTEAAAVPAQHQTCGRRGLCRQNWGLFIKSTWRSRAGWGGTGAWTRHPSASAPGPTPSQDSHFTAWFRVKCWGGGERDEARHIGGAVVSTSLLRWCWHDRRNMKL